LNGGKPRPITVSLERRGRLLVARPATVQAPRATSYVDFLRGAAAQDVAGGRTYDLVIGVCARDAGAAVLLTFNRRHFDPPPAGVRVLEPALT